MNMGYEDDEELVPFKEPTLDIGDTKRIDILVGMGYNRHEVEQSLQTHKFDDAYASYLLLGRRSTDVSGQSYFLDHRTAHFFASLLHLYNSLSVWFTFSANLNTVRFGFGWLRYILNRLSTVQTRFYSQKHH